MDFYATKHETKTVKNFNSFELFLQNCSSSARPESVEPIFLISETKIQDSNI